MAEIGNHLTFNAGDSYNLYGNNSSNMLFIKVTMPSSGQITFVAAYFAGHGQTITVRLCVYNNSGTLVAQTNDISVGSGGGNAAGQWYVGSSLTSPYNAANGEQLYLGFWRHANQSHEWTEKSTSTEYQHTDTSNSAPPASTTFGATGGQPGIYAVYTPFSVPSSITFTPSDGPVGTSVAVSGSGFTGATSVAFNGTSATFTLNSDTSITTTVPSGATTGTISVTNPAGTGTSGATFTVTQVPRSITFTPGSGPSGTSVAISGSHFSGATSVKFNGTTASFTVNNDTSITATAPAGGTNGEISITNSAGTGYSSASYIFSSVYGDDSANFQPGTFYANDGAGNWQLAQAWANDGAGSPAWHQIA